MVSARADPKEPATQGGAAEAAPTWTREGVPTPHEGKAHESDGVKVPSVAEAAEVEAPLVSEAKAAEAGAPRTIEVAAAGAGAPATTEAMMAEVGAPGATEAMMAEAEAPRAAKAMMAEARVPGTTEVDVIMVRPSAQEVEMKAAEASVAPLIQGPPSLRDSTREVEVLPISSNDTSRAQEMADAEVAGTVEQPVLTLGEGSSALMQELETRSLGKSVFLRWERDVWDQLQRQKGLLVDANELLSVQSIEVEDLRLCCADAKVEAATAQEQVTPLAARVKELEEELTRVAGDQDAFKSRAKEAMTLGKALAGQLGAEQSAHQLTKGTLDEALTMVEASQTEAVVWRGKAEESEAEVTRVAEASIAVQVVLETEIREHKVLKSAARTTCEALEVKGVQLGSSLGSRLIALSGQVRERLRGALHIGVKCTLAIIASHYIGVDLQAISDGYILPNDDEEANEAVAKLMEAAEGPGMALAKLFEEEVVASPLSTDAGGPKP
ncbi:uncharacterized protein [Miscanthus floridulus]|uniref:uncharacterized protein n=1 Tax=Miscanthus floridulus TaxID=154761 RepID=UPI00345A74EA